MSVPVPVPRWGFPNWSSNWRGSGSCSAGPFSWRGVGCVRRGVLWCATHVPIGDKSRLFTSLSSLQSPLSLCWLLSICLCCVSSSFICACCFVFSTFFFSFSTTEVHNQKRKKKSTFKWAKKKNRRGKPVRKGVNMILCVPGERHSHDFRSESEIRFTRENSVWNTGHRERIKEDEGREGGNVFVLCLFLKSDFRPLTQS